MPRVVPAKISRPKISGILERERLFCELDSARERPAVWISSPAGSGKTTLVSSYIDNRKLKSLWFQVDDGDNDIATFFYYMSLAGKLANRRKKKKLPLLTPEYLTGIPTFAKRFFEELCSRLQPPYVLVLDNYQEVGNDSPLHDIIRNGLSVIPEGINMIIISRSEPPPAMAPLRVGRSLNIIGWPQLRLQPGELVEFVGLNRKKELQDDVIQQLYVKTDGWIAGLVLMLERMKSGERAAASFSGRPPGEIFEYFAVEIFNRLAGTTQDFLLKTAFVPSVSIEFARKMTNAQDAEHILNSLSRNHFFTDRRRGTETVYQYHPLFREFLLDLAHKWFSAEEMNEIRQNAAGLLEELDWVEEAAELYRGAENWHRLGQLVIRNAAELMAQGRSKTITTWIMAMPVEIIEANPWLLFWMGQGLLYHRPGESRSHFEKAFRLFCEQEEVPGIYLSWCGIVESIEYGFDSLTPLTEWIDELEELTRKFGAVPEGDIAFRVVSSMVTALVMTMPDHPKMDEWLEKALSLTKSSSNTNIKVLTLFHCSYFMSNRGDFTRAQEMVLSLKEMSARPDTTHFVRIIAELAKALYYQHIGQVDDCIRAVSTGLQLAAFSGIHFLDFQLMGQAVMSCLSRSDFQKADQYLDSMGEHFSSVPNWDKAFYYFLQAWKAFLLRDLPNAEGYGDMAFRLTFEVGAAPSNFLCSLEKALVLHAAGSHEKALQYLKKAYDNGRRFRGDFLEFGCLLTEAFFCLQTGREQKGLAALNSGMSIGRQNGYLNMYMWYPDMMGFLCTKALEQEIEDRYVQGLIRYHHIMPEPPPSHLDNWPWAIKVYTLGGFAVEVDGAPLVFSGKAQKKPLELLQAIIALGGESVRDEQIIDALWPDSDGDMAMQSFRTTISRLRRLLQHDKAITTGAGKIGLDQRYVWTDVRSFERGIERGKHAVSGIGAKNDAVSRQQKVLDRYRGEFLQDCDCPWVMPMRERIRNLYLYAIMDIGRDLEESGEMEWAIEVYRKGLELDSLVEGLYQRLIACYGGLGRNAEAVRTYDRCRSVLALELGIEPSQKTVELLRRYVNVQG